MKKRKNKHAKHKHCKNDELDCQKLYFKQLELLKRPTSKNCEEVIKIDNTLLSASDKYVFSTGSCTNAARANLCILYKTKNTAYLEAAKKACDKAIQLKPENQQARLLVFEINMFTSDFSAAAQTLRLLDKAFLSEAQMQILALYQNALNDANIYEHSAGKQQSLEILTNTLFEAYGDHPALCGIATTYYIGIGNDVVRTYEVAKKCVDQWPNVEVLCTLGLVCITPPLNRPGEAIAYLKKGLDICESDELRFGLKSNLLAALIKAKQWEQAEKLSKDLIENTPSNMNYHNYAELLKHLTRYDEAVDWCKKALFLVEDDCTLLTLADIYRRNTRYDDAIANYLKCLASQEHSGNSLSFIDENGNDLYSLASNAAINGIKLEA
ncbi:MAG: tetratricopeptide repeat protein, partial [Oscillospiraceae bacterium]